MADVRRNVPVPVMADESCYTLQDAMALARAGAADILSIYVGKGGGIGPARKIAAVAHLATATTGVGAEEFPCDILGPLAYEEDLLVDPLQVREGAVRAPDKP